MLKNISMCCTKSKSDNTCHPKKSILKKMSLKEILLET